MRLKNLLTHPSCLLGPAIWLANSDSARFHRDLVKQAWPSRPRWQWLLLLIENWLFWYLFLFWRNLYLCLKSPISNSLQERGFSKGMQCKAIIKLGLWLGAPPADYFVFSLYRRASLADWINYVFSSEQLTWHRVHSCPLGAKSAETLNDKLAFENLLKAQGISSSHTLKHAQSAGDLEQDLLFGSKDLFIKPQKANAMRGCLSLSSSSGGWVLKGFDMQRQPVEKQGKKEIQDFLQGLVEQTPLLIQEHLQNARVISQYAESEALVTLRVITGRVRERVFPAYVCLEVENGPLSWCVYPVDLATGVPEHPADFKEQASEYRQYDQPIPEFEKLIHQATQLHGLFTDIKTLAWDFCLTEEGWTAIEGNTGWGLISPQQVSGLPLLASELASAYRA